jgi:hypothetical protein
MQAAKARSSLPPLASLPPGHKVITARMGWYKVVGTLPGTKPPQDNQTWLNEGTRGERVAHNRARFGRYIVDVRDANEYSERIVSLDKFNGMDLTPDQRTAAVEVARRYGRSYKPNYAAALLGGQVDLATGLSTMPHTPRQHRVVQGGDVDIPSPPEAPNGHFGDFSKQDAEAFAQELRKLKGEPVMLSGGGGWGHNFVFLEDVKVIPNWAFVPGPDGKPIDARKPGEWRPRDDKPWYVVDRTKPPRNYSVSVRLRAFPGETITDKLHFSPHLGSWRITALSGYGAERLRKTWPAGWE